MTEMQTRLLDALKWFHNLCQENQLTYYALGGTVLGAMRHQGFIPWDDDIDVGMPWEDYKKLILLLNSMPDDERYVIECPHQKDFVYLYSKIYDTKTTLIEDTRYKTKRGIFIDVFPLSGMGNSYMEAKAHFRKIDRKVKLHLTKVCAIRKERSLFKNLSIILSRCIPNFLLNRKKLEQYIEKLSQRYSFYNSEYVANAVGNWHEKEIVKREWFGKPTLRSFETMEIYCPEDSHSYLTAIYGDYMKLPPIEKRVSEHAYIKVDLNRSYLDE